METNVNQQSGGKTKEQACLRGSGLRARTRTVHKLASVFRSKYL